MNQCRALFLSLMCVLALLLPGCGRLSPADSVPGSEERAGTIVPDPAGVPPLEDMETASATVMIYLIGSDLESDFGLGTMDLEEMLRADLGNRVNLVIQTMGCQEWHNETVSAATAQRFTVEDNALVCLQDDLGQLDSTDPATLLDFIRYCDGNYPADRNILILWDHGAGPVYGFGYDEFRPTGAALTLDEIQSALNQAGVKFDFIGFDACLMGCLETCYALRDCADYLICSEDFVSGYGWEYQYWLTELGDNVAIPTEELGKTIVDTYITESEQAGDPGVMAVIDLSALPALYSAWTAFSYTNQTALVSTNYSWATRLTRRNDSTDWPEESDGTAIMEDYYITDLMALASTLGGQEGRNLAQALSHAVVYSASNTADSSYSGLAVTLPYGNGDFYSSLAEVYTCCGFDAAYVSWLARFANAPGVANFYDRWGEWAELWDNSSHFGGWAAYENGCAWNPARSDPNQ